MELQQRAEEIKNSEHSNGANGDPTSCSVLPADLTAKAQKELYEKAEWRRRDIEALRQMIIGEVVEHQLNPCLDEAFLLRFLRARKFDYERANKLFFNYYNIRHTFKNDIFEDLQPSTTHEIFSRDLLGFLDDVVDCNGRRILVFKASNWSFSSANQLDDLLKAAVLCMEAELANESTQINGIVVLIDAVGLSLVDVFQRIKPVFVKKVFSCFQDAFPCRLKAVHFVNESAAIEGLLTIMKPFMTEKFRQRLYFHGTNIESLCSHIDRDSLPSDFGGTGRPFSAKCWYEYLLSKQSYFEKLNSYRYLDSPPTTAQSAEHSPLKSVLNTYKRFCIDGLNS